MRKTHTRIAGAVAALLAAGLAGFSLRSAPRSSTALAARTPSAAVTTQVIRRTIHIVRHEHARSRGAVHPGSVSAPTAAAAVSAARSIHTGASGSHHAGSSGTVVSAGGSAVTTRTSPSHVSAPTASVPASSPVTTRTSPHGSSGTSGAKHVTTRSSGEDRGDHGD